MNLAFALPAVRPGAPASDFIAARQHMLESQVAPGNIIQSSVLSAMGAVPREVYVPAEFQDRAYSDRNLAWQDGFLISPLQSAQLLEHLVPHQPDHVLVLESGSGYITALASRIFPKVTALFPDVGPAKTALNHFTVAKYGNIAVKSGLLMRGWSRSAPYQAILFTGAASSMPDSLAQQLPEGGYAVGFFPSGNGLVKLGLWLKMHGALSYCVLADATVPFLPGLTPPATFRF